MNEEEEVLFLFGQQSFIYFLYMYDARALKCNVVLF